MNAAAAWRKTGITTAFRAFPFLVRCSCRALLSFSLLAPLWAADISFGIKVGVPFTQYFETGATGSLHGGANYSAATRRYTLGVSGDWAVKRHFAFEADVLFHRMGYVGIVNTFDEGLFTKSAIDVKGDSWDFPLMMKYRFGRVIRPYIAGGGVLRYVGPVRGRGELTEGDLVAGTSSATKLDTSQPSELRKRFYPGLTAGAGIEFHAGHVRVLPELRYTRWTSNIAGPGGLLRFAPNQVEFLAGVLF